MDDLSSWRRRDLAGQAESSGTITSKCWMPRFNMCYWMELDNAPVQKMWACRKAAWAIEDTEQDLGLVYRAMGWKGLQSIENVGPRMAEVVEKLFG
jgi:hypothetical protein